MLCLKQQVASRCSLLRCKRPPLACNPLSRPLGCCPDEAAVCIPACITLCASCVLPPSCPADPTCTSNPTPPRCFPAAWPAFPPFPRRPSLPSSLPALMRTHPQHPLIACLLPACTLPAPSCPCTAGFLVPHRLPAALRMALGGRPGCHSHATTPLSYTSRCPLLLAPTHPLDRACPPRMNLCRISQLPRFSTDACMHTRAPPAAAALPTLLRPLLSNAQASFRPPRLAAVPSLKQEVAPLYRPARLAQSSVYMSHPLRCCGLQASVFELSTIGTVLLPPSLSSPTDRKSVV